MDGTTKEVWDTTVHKLSVLNRQTDGTLYTPKVGNGKREWKEGKKSIEGLQLREWARGGGKGRKCGKEE